MSKDFFLARKKELWEAHESVLLKRLTFLTRLWKFFLNARNKIQSNGIGAEFVADETCAARLLAFVMVAENRA